MSSKVLFAVPLVLASGLVVVGCGAGPTSDPASGSPSTPVSESPGPSGSAGREAWIRGTKVTLTNDTGEPIEVSTLTSDELKGEYTGFSALENGASTSLTDQWNSTAASWVQMMIRRSGATDEAELAIGNPIIDSPWVKACGTTKEIDCLIKVDETEPDEGQTVTVEARNVEDNHLAATFTVTRVGDDDDNKNWTVSVTEIK